MLSITVGLLI